MEEISNVPVASQPQAISAPCPWLEVLLNDLILKKNTDFTFIVGKNADRVSVHKLPLRLGSKIFDNLSSDQHTEYSIPEVQLNVFNYFIRFIYTNTLEADIDVGDLLKLSYLSKKYEVPSLIAECNNRLISAPVTINNCLEIFSAASGLGLIDLKDQIFKFILKNGNALFSSNCEDERDRILHLTESDLKKLFESDQLQCSEIHVFKAALRWATVNSTSASDIQKRFKPFLSLIRFPLMSAQEVADEVTNTGILTPHQIITLFTYLNASRKPEITFSKTNPRVPLDDIDVEFKINSELEFPEEMLDQWIPPVIENVCGSSEIQNDSNVGISENIATLPKNNLLPTPTSATRKRKSPLNATASELPGLVTTVEENSTVTKKSVHKKRKPAQPNLETDENQEIAFGSSFIGNNDATLSSNTTQNSSKKKKRKTHSRVTFSDCNSVIEFETGEEIVGNGKVVRSSVTDSTHSIPLVIPMANNNSPSTSTDCNSVIGSSTREEIVGNRKVIRISVTEISSSDSIPVVIPIPNESPSNSADLNNAMNVKEYSLEIDLKIEREESYKRFVTSFNIQRYLCFIKEGKMLYYWNIKDLWGLNIPITIKVNKSTLLNINQREKELSVNLGVDSTDVFKGLPKTSELLKLNLLKTNLPTETGLPPRVQQSSYDGFPTELLEQVTFYHVWCDSINSLGKFTRQCPNLVTLCSYLIVPGWYSARLDLTRDLVSGGKLRKLALSETQIRFNMESLADTKIYGVTELVFDRCGWTADFVGNIHKIFPNVEKVSFREPPKKYTYWGNDGILVFSSFSLRMLFNLLKVTSLKYIRIWGMTWDFKAFFPPKDNGDGSWKVYKNYKGLEMTKPDKEYMEIFLKNCGVKIPSKGNTWNFLIEKDEEGRWKGREFNDKESMDKKGGFWEYQDQLEYEQFQLDTIYDDCHSFDNCFFKNFHS